MVNESTEQDGHSLFIGPWPPPVHGQALATLSLHRALVAMGAPLVAMDTSEGSGSTPRKGVRKLGRNLIAALRTLSLERNQAVYISANTGAGMWLTVLICVAARLRRSRILIHHHSYDYITRGRFRARVLARVSGLRAVHIVLGDTMGEALRRRVLSVRRTFSLNNAGLIDDRLLTIDLRRTQIVLGHLSNLSAAKGIRETVDLAIAASQSGLDIRLVIAGPITDQAAEESIARAHRSLGKAFEYRGPMDADAKLGFYSDISHFVFATNYRNEAAPLVLLEAMASGVPCLSRPLGVIEEQLGADGGHCVAMEGDFVGEGVNWLARTAKHQMHFASKARKRFADQQSEYESQLAGLFRLMNHDLTYNDPDCERAVNE